jgi:muramoyltetrapeptide carboxypeptidase
MSARIRGIAPSWRLDEAAARRAIARARSLGLALDVADRVFAQDRQFAGTDESRAAELRAALADPRARALWCLRGGYGAARTLDRLDLAGLKRRGRPPLLAGYSDATVLLLAAWRRGFARPVHGPMLMDWARPKKRASWRRMVRFLAGDASAAIGAADFARCRVLRPGRAAGGLIAGNLTLLTRALGTEYDIDTAGAILIVEDTDEKLYALDRMFLHLRQAGKFRRLAGLILGGFDDLADSATPFGATVAEMALEHARDYRFPILAGFPCGHGGANVPVPWGWRCEFAAEDEGVSRLRLSPRDP